jgi:hypothetical protein
MTLGNIFLKNRGQQVCYDPVPSDLARQIGIENPIRIRDLKK